MERSRRNTVIELLCAGHHPAAIIKLFKYPRRTVYDITRRGRSTSPGLTGSARPQLWLDSRGPSRPIRGRLCPSSPGSVGSTCRRLLDGLCGLRDPVRIPAGLGARPQGQTCAVLAEEECAQLLAPNSPDLNPCDYYYNLASLKASIKSEMNKLDPAE
ncbi:Transposable element tcb1 transposase, partial [Caligus rogercresseyi]